MTPHQLALLALGLSTITAIALLGARHATRIRAIRSGDAFAHWPASDSSPEVFISRHGLYWPRRRWRLHDFSAALLNVRLSPDERELHFRYLHPVWRDGRRLRLVQRVCLPVPPGRSEEARAVIAACQPLLCCHTAAHHDRLIIERGLSAAVAAAMLWLIFTPGV